MYAPLFAETNLPSDPPSWALVGGVLVSLLLLVNLFAGILNVVHRLRGKSDDFATKAALAKTESDLNARIAEFQNARDAHDRAMDKKLDEMTRSNQASFNQLFLAIGQLQGSTQKGDSK